MRALTACLPDKFQVDGDGRKAAWRALFLQRVQGLVAQVGDVLWRHVVMCVVAASGTWIISTQPRCWLLLVITLSLYRRGVFFQLLVLVLVLMLSFFLSLLSLLLLLLLTAVAVADDFLILFVLLLLLLLPVFIYFLKSFQERGDTVSGGWDPEKDARRTVRLPALTAEQVRRPEYLYPTTAEVEGRVEKLQERQRKLEDKEAKLAKVSCII